MLHAEAKTSKTYSKKYDWSPTLRTVVKTDCYWQLRLKRSKGLRVSDRLLAKAAEAAGLHEEHQAASTLPQIIHKIRESRTNLRALQKQHIELRVTHLESLAEARLIHKNKGHQSLHPDKQEEACKREVRPIKRTKKIKWAHRWVRACLKPTDDSSLLTSINVPNKRELLEQLDCKKIKSWEGSWRTIIDPEELAHQICQANAH
jgi:hypothetical protein